MKITTSLQASNLLILSPLSHCTLGCFWFAPTALSDHNTRCCWWFDTKWEPDYQQTPVDWTITITQHRSYSTTRTFASSSRAIAPDDLFYLIVTYRHHMVSLNITNIGLSISRASAGLSSTGPVGIYFSEIVIEIKWFSFMNLQVKASSLKCGPFFTGLISVFFFNVRQSHVLLIVFLIFFNHTRRKQTQIFGGTLEVITRLLELLYVFEHKTQYLFIRAPYTYIVVFWHMSNIPPMI